MGALDILKVRALLSGAMASPPEAENLLAFGCPTEAANLPHSSYFANSLNPRHL